MIKWSLVEKKLSDLKDYPKNPRQISKDQTKHLSTSINKFGLIDKPIINLDGTIIGGHQRKRILKDAGFKTVQCWTPNRPLTENEIEELNIRLNRNSGSWDFDILANMLNFTDLLEWGFTTDDFPDLDIEQILHDNQNTDDKKAKKCKLCPHCGKEL